MPCRGTTRIRRYVIPLLQLYSCLLPMSSHSLTCWTCCRQIMDLDPDKSVAFQLSQKSGRLIHRKKEKKRVRRKKIYWTPIDPGKVNEESIWSMVRGSVEMDKLKYDPKEFENLFTESSNPADKKKAAARKDKSKQQKKAVQVIDGKRSMNGGIILARLKMEYSKIAEMVDVM